MRGQFSFEFVIDVGIALIIVAFIVVFFTSISNTNSRAVTMSGVCGKTECDFLYKKKPEDDRMEPWAADVVLIYRENGRKICEVIEVETINISRFYKRIKNINAKAGNPGHSDRSCCPVFVGHFQPI